MSELFEQVAGIADLQNKAMMAGLELGRDESRTRIAGLEATNAKLLDAAKRAYSVFQAEKEGGDYYDRTAYLMLEDAITEAGE